MGPRSLKLKIMHPTAKFCDAFSATGAQRPDELSRTALVRLMEVAGFCVRRFERYRVRDFVGI